VKVSGQCITFGRPNLLEEAIESFFRQDYEGEKELVILNDHPEQFLVFDHPEVVIINSPRRFRTVGEKRNACVALCTGDIIFPWDDDDISLPWRISLSLQFKGNKRYFKNTSAWLWNNGQIKGLRKNVYHAMGCWDRTFFYEVEGYPFMQSGQDSALESRFRKTGEREVIELSPEEVFYIYKFGGTGHAHLSSFGWNKGWDEIGKKRIKDKGEIHLAPQWKEDYGSVINEILKEKALPD
jgi:glycosyltransferase involved in cell wall biosynthesis